MYSLSSQIAARAHYYIPKWLAVVLLPVTKVAASQAELPCIYARDMLTIILLQSVLDLAPYTRVVGSMMAKKTPANRLSRLFARCLIIAPRLVPCIAVGS